MRSSFVSVQRSASSKNKKKSATSQGKILFSFAFFLWLSLAAA
jgi:hypothetical protein